jgi:hypothetical protein
MNLINISQVFQINIEYTKQLSTRLICGFATPKFVGKLVTYRKLKTNEDELGL